jgi:DNA gyrase subunit A
MDYVTSLLVESTHDQMLLFTNEGKCYPLKIYEIPEAGRTSRGVSLAQMLNLGRSEIPQAVVTLREMRESDNIVLVTKKGIIKKVKLLDFANAHSGGIIAQKMKEGDELFAAEKVIEGKKIFIASSNGQVIKFDESILRQMGRTAQGVIGMNIPNGESIVSCVIGDEKIKDLIFISDDGYGKRVDVSEFRETNRGGKGVIGMKLTKGRKLQRMVGISGEEELMAITEAGKIIRLNAKDISKQHRNTRGVRVVSVKGEDKVTDIAIITD